MIVVKPFKNDKNVKDTTILDLITVLEGLYAMLVMMRRHLYERRGRCP